MDFERPGKRSGQEKHDQSREAVVVSVLLSHAEKVIEGELVFGDAIMSQLSRAIEQLEVSPDTADLIRRGKEMIGALPIAEVRNCKDRAAQFAAAGDYETAKLWSEEAARRESALSGSA